MAGLVSRIKQPKERSQALRSAGSHGCLLRRIVVGRAPFLATLIMAAKRNDIDPNALACRRHRRQCRHADQQIGAIAAVKLDAEDVERPDGVICTPNWMPASLPDGYLIGRRYC